MMEVMFKWRHNAHARYYRCSRQLLIYRVFSPLYFFEGNRVRFVNHQISTEGSSRRYFGWKTRGLIAEDCEDLKSRYFHVSCTGRTLYIHTRMESLEMETENTLTRPSALPNKPAILAAKKSKARNWHSFNVRICVDDRRIIHQSN